jgi:hypothetical protein
MISDCYLNLGIGDAPKAYPAEEIGHPHSPTALITRRTNQVPGVQVEEEIAVQVPVLTAGRRLHELATFSRADDRPDDEQHEQHGVGGGSVASHAARCDVACS